MQFMNNSKLYQMFLFLSLSLSLSHTHTHTHIHSHTLTHTHTHSHTQQGGMTIKAFRETVSVCMAAEYLHY